MWSFSRPTLIFYPRLDREKDISLQLKDLYLCDTSVLSSVPLLCVSAKCQEIEHRGLPTISAGGTYRSALILLTSDVIAVTTPQVPCSLTTSTAPVVARKTLWCPDYAINACSISN